MSSYVTHSTCTVENISLEYDGVHPWSCILQVKAAN